MAYPFHCNYSIPSGFVFVLVLLSNIFLLVDKLEETFCGHYLELSFMNGFAFCIFLFKLFMYVQIDLIGTNTLFGDWHKLTFSSNYLRMPRLICNF